MPRQPHQAIAIGKLLNSNPSGRCGKLVNHARHLAALESALLSVLPPEWKHHCTVANVQDETLVVSTSSPVWAARARLMAPQLMEQLQVQCPNKALRALHVKIYSRLETTDEPNITRPVLSSGSARLLLSVSKQCSDNGLRRALERLSKNA
ncbi:MAG: DciA family protein [Gammaproteobacteria bacterium]